MNKKGFELSLNFIIVIVLSIIIFSFGIWIFNKIMDQGGEYTEMTLDQLNQQIIELQCPSSERVCTSPSSKRIKPNDFGVFTLGVLNTGKEQQFTINISEAPGLGIGESDYWLFEDKLKLGLNEHKRKGIGVEVPGGTPKGTYVLNVKVYNESGAQYGNTQKLQIIVP